MKIRTTFYTREITDHKHVFVKTCKGEIYGKNIWVKNPDDLPNCPNLIAEFKYLYSPSYLRVSEKKVNTHFKYKISRKKYNEEAVFAKLNLLQRFKLKMIMGETGYHRNPIEFGLLLVTFLGVMVALFWGIINWKGHKESNERLFRELQELRKDVKEKEIQVINNLHLSDSLSKLEEK